jgi:hypothetical protein
MGGDWSADDCLHRAAILARSSSTASEKGRDKPDGAARTTQPEPDLDEKGECVVLSGAEDGSTYIDAQVTLPLNARGGMKLQLAIDSSDRRFQIVLPEGAVGGKSITVKIPIPERTS